jgi:hypothetical protein
LNALSTKCHHHGWQKVSSVSTIYLGTAAKRMLPLVVECALMFCHKKDTAYVFVRDLAEKVNDLLVGRHADFKVEDRKVGSVLNDLGIGKRRVTRGFRVDLTSEMRKRIHRIAVAYNVFAAESAVTNCADCRNNNQSAQLT